MQKHKLYQNDWLAVHPYRNLQPTDPYFVGLANRLLSLSSPLCNSLRIPVHYQKKLSIYMAAYLEDVISDLHLWQAFTTRCMCLYGCHVPFYDVMTDYETTEINEADVKFIVWNTLQSAHFEHAYFHPMDDDLSRLSAQIYAVLDDVYETAPSNDALADYLFTFANHEEAVHKLNWLFAHTYLTEPSVHTFELEKGDEYEFTCGPLALFLREWMQNIPHDGQWENLSELQQGEESVSAEQRAKNFTQYEEFMQGTDGNPVAYLQGYQSLHHFLTEVLHWPDDDDHTLPGMKSHKNYVLMAHKHKGLLLAPDLCGCISDPKNPYYNSSEAGSMAFSLLTEPGKCPADLLHYIIAKGYLPEAQCPSDKTSVTIHTSFESNRMKKDWVGDWMDFIARQALGYYYRAE